MTEEQLGGRALDEACAKAMGWRWAQHYSTDPATQAEKLAHLTAGGHTVGINCTEHAVECWLEGEWFGNKSPMGQGTTISQALARLVVAVAKERSK